jgi:excisionase family DNA binding protein
MSIEKIGYSVEEAVTAMGVGRTTVYELIGSGELESIKVGRRRVIPADSIRAYFDSRRAASHDGGRHAAPAAQATEATA